MPEVSEVGQAIGDPLEGPGSAIMALEHHGLEKKKPMLTYSSSQNESMLCWSLLS